MFVKTVTMPSGIKTLSSTIQNHSSIVTITPDSMREDKMAYYKQFCSTLKGKNTQIPLKTYVDEMQKPIQSHNNREDKMAFYKQFSEKK